MKWQEAVKFSKHNIARRTIFTDNKDKISTSIVWYDDGSGYLLISKNEKVDFDLSREVKKEDIPEFEKYDDWEPI